MENEDMKKVAQSLETISKSLSAHLSSLRWQSWLKTSGILSIMGVYLIFMIIPLKALNGSSANGSEPVPEMPANISSSYVKREMGVKEKVAIVKVSDVITEMGKNGEDLVQNLANKLKAAREDPNVKAVILEVNSPGGSVNASDLMWKEIKEFKKSGKPLVAFFNGLAASGGYYISMPADKIVATPTTITGSIGVIAQIPNFTKLLDKLGVEMITVKSGPRKDMLSPYRPMQEEDRKIMQELIDDSYSRFVRIVSEGRKMKKQRVRVLADGRIYHARKALAVGLVDQVGYLEDAFQTAKQLANIEKASLVRYEVRPNLLIGLLGELKKNQIVNIEKPAFSKGLRLYYLPKNTLILD
jgi:protease IV